MRARDTVMHLDDIDEGRMPDSYGSLRRVLEKQAEITWKACIKEVVEWVQKSIDFTNLETERGNSFSITWEKWQSKLKEWGV